MRDQVYGNATITGIIGKSRRLSQEIDIRQMTVTECVITVDAYLPRQWACPLW